MFKIEVNDEAADSSRSTYIGLEIDNWIITELAAGQSSARAFCLELRVSLLVVDGKVTLRRLAGPTSRTLESQVSEPTMISADERGKCMIHMTQERQAAALHTSNALGDDAVRDLSGALTALLADCFALYLKTKNFHWHMSGRHFRDHHLLLDEHGNQIFAMTDPIAERVRKLGGTTLRSIGQISRLQRLLDNDSEFVSPGTMLAELRDDNRQVGALLRETHELCERHGDLATASLIEVWLDETERRTWFLFEATRD